MTTLDQLSGILVKHYKINPASITPHQPLDQLGIDSLGMAELLFFIEDEFHIQLPADAPLLPTLADAADLIDDLIARHGPPLTVCAEPAPPA
jgi:acyl carrier protein